MRTRLIELMRRFEYKCQTPCDKLWNGTTCHECKLGQLADYFLAHDVVLPPCEAKGRMWHLSRRGNIYEVIVNGFRVIWKKRKPQKQLYIYTKRVHDGQSNRYPYKDFYRTEKEAKDALKVRKKGDA